MSAQRQLAAIMFADIMGYTAMMQKDESNAMLLRTKFDDTLQLEVKIHHGRVIQFNGDGALCMFNSAIEAVKASISIQLVMRNEPIVPLRIGIHVGDIVFEGHNIYGDGVNVASRVESFAVAGGVFVSGRVNDEIQNQKDITAVSMGKFNLKNVTLPVDIYAISNEGLLVPTRKSLEGKGTLAKKKNNNVFIASAIIILMILIGGYFFLNRHPISSNSKSVAVLPFLNISKDSTDDYLSDGITEDILTNLTKIADLKVISRNSSMQYKGTKKSTKQIAEELGVSTILEGSIQRYGKQIHITAQLIDAKTDRSLWADTYDKELNQVFEFQSEVATKIASSLEARLSQDEKKRIEKSSEVNTEAYNLFLQARYFRKQRGELNLEKSITLLNSALKIDSSNALIWAELAFSYSDLADDGYIETTSGYYKANQAAMHALSLPDIPAEAHLAMGNIKELYYWDWSAAESEYQKALSLEPGNADVIRFVGGLQETLGKLDTAIKYYNKSLELDPLSAPTLSYLAYCLFKAGKLNESEATYKKLIDFQPNRPDAHESLGEVYLLMGKYDLALQQMNKEQEELWRLYGLLLVYTFTNNKSEAEKNMKVFIEKYENEVGYQLAQIYAIRNEKDKAFEYMDRAYSQRDAGLAEMKTDPFLRNLWSDKRWKDFLVKMKLI